MPSSILSRADFEKNIEGAMKAASDGPVFITEDGMQTYVLLTIESYRLIVGDQTGAIEV